MTIIYAEKVQDDLDAMELFILSNHGSRKIVADIAAAIKKHVEELEILPCRYRKWEGTEYRFFNVKGYYVFYRYDEQEDEIIVERVLHSHRDIDNLI